ncbi:UPF0149 family protein [Luteibacter sp. 9135]|uniref:UPF0149 family protein n=1 Tax=Luteibacter sp. 9135 TaxID=1500893 RepID=UPI000569CC7C|nr:UPF0149 family protein [Luteibacter sp. 9135]
MQMNEARLGRLDDLLISTNRYSLETLDGLFSAAIVGPAEVDIDDCMAIFDAGEATPWESEAVHAEVAELLKEFWAVIQARVSGDPKIMGEESLPFVDSPEEFDELEDVSTYDGDFPLASDWALGFRFAIDAWEEEWSEWLDESTYPFVGMLLTLTADQTDPDPGTPAVPLPTFEERMTLLNEIPFQLATLYRRRHPEHGRPQRRDESKVGRNDSCTCGSGKKFKKCCGAGG